MYQHYIRLGVYAVIALFILLQWFMATRPWAVWGLALPLMFAVAWYCVVKQPISLIGELGLTEDAVSVMSRCCKLGIVISLALFALCRCFRFIRLRQKAKRRQERLEEKRRRQLREEAITSQVTPGNVQFRARSPLEADVPPPLK